VPADLPPLLGVRDQLVQQGITINGLAILTEEPWLEDYYRHNVIGGPSGFCLVAENMESFADAMLRKLVQEIAGRPDVHFAEFVYDYDTFFRRFSRAGFDIGLAPLPDDEFHRSKSDNKFREYAASRIAGIYSDVPVYRECVAHGRTGLLVPPGPGAWASAMTRLIEDDELRTRMQIDGWTTAKARYGMDQTKELWLAHFHAALANEQPAAKPGPVAPTPSGARRTVGFIRRVGACQTIMSPSWPKCLRYTSHSTPCRAYGDDATSSIAPGTVAMLGRSALSTSSAGSLDVSEGQSNFVSECRDDRATANGPIATGVNFDADHIPQVDAFLSLDLNHRLQRL
jgi:hypothetical protein